MSITVFKHEISLHLGAKCKWSHIKLHKAEGTKHLVWGKLSLYIEDLTSAHYAVCAECNSSEIGEVSTGDESLTICDGCRSVEQGYKYLTKREYEAL